MLVVAASAACGDGTIDPGAYTVRDSAGVRIIESSAAAWMPPRIIESEPLRRTPDRYEITLFDAAGVKRRILRRPIEPRPVEQAEVDRHIEALLENVRQREGDAAVPSSRRRYEETSHFGERVPLFGIAFVDRDQRLWVSGPGWPDAEAGLRAWTVFSPKGLLLCELEAPPRLRIVDSRDDLVLGIWTDELDVPHIQVHRIVASGSM